MLASHSVQINSSILRKAWEEYDLVWTKKIGSVTFISRQGFDRVSIGTRVHSKYFEGLGALSG